MVYRLLDGFIGRLEVMGFGVGHCPLSVVSVVEKEAIFDHAL